MFGRTFQDLNKYIYLFRKKYIYFLSGSWITEWWGGGLSVGMRKASSPRIWGAGLRLLQHSHEPRIKGTGGGMEKVRKLLCDIFILNLFQMKPALVHRGRGLPSGTACWAMLRSRQSSTACNRKQISYILTTSHKQTKRWQCTYSDYSRREIKKLCVLALGHHVSSDCPKGSDGSLTPQ